MKKRFLPIPLILLIPILLLIVVTLAGIYRFSLSDEEIRAKFPNHSGRHNEVMFSAFGLRTTNPWTIKVPETQAFTFIDEIDVESGHASGQYEDGEERGDVDIDMATLVQVDPARWVAIMTVSNQGSGVFYYMTSFAYDQFRKRMISEQAILLGDRIVFEKLEVNANRIEVTIHKRDVGQPMSQEPSNMTTILFELSEQENLRQLN
ncbi:hypothetical protein ACODM8_11355 [Vibrio ostreicida]|uniref:Uncharacterized protein n=1 Tax=Vibrio ostreicida TaxID=526588 RepID=A0ABT8C110_9VIBR|nr:hypothetical protein [Vibrio ostreicida]MDN3612344.1 hypothetical protein [Vibrio ostreicida]NPD08721.1 hypothetical protein [Vibrio ostreicida]